jgi:hypothetical protein
MLIVSIYVYEFTKEYQNPSKYLIIFTIIQNCILCNPSYLSRRRTFH